MQTTEKKHFWRDYWIITFEGIAVALLIATLALIGVYWKLVFPVFLQLIVVFLWVRYKRYKTDTERAIEAIVEKSVKAETVSIKALANDIQREYYKEHGVDTKIRSYQFWTITLLLASIVLVFLFPFLEEREKRHAAKEREDAVERREAEIIEKIEALKPSVENLTQKLEAINTRIEAREAEIRLLHERDKTDATRRTKGK